VGKEDPALKMSAKHVLRFLTARGVLSGAIFGLFSRWSLTDSWIVAAEMGALFGASMAVLWLVFAFFERQREAAKRL
jgi:Zn-dependent protease with chaperone function